MKGARRIWLAFAACLVVLAGGMAMLSRTALRLDAEGAAYLAAAEREERIRLALWRMDAAVTNFVAAEAARPVEQFEPFHVSLGPEPYPSQSMFLSVPKTLQYAATVDGGRGLAPSELLTGGSPLVRLYFRIDADGAVHSPQAPEPPVRKLAVERGYVSEGRLARAERVRETFAGDLQPKELLAALPQPEPPPVDAVLPVANTNLTAQVDQRGRGGDEFAVRQSVVTNSLNVQGQFQQAPAPAGIRNGPVRALWAGEKLLLARRVEASGSGWIVGCWLDWPALQGWLLAGVRDLLPEATLAAHRPDESADPARMLAALPVRIAPGSIPAAAPTGSATATALAAAWAGALLAAAAVGLLLRRTLALAERRAAFVSAVTHELRTPLTTFAMYAEMLADGTVTEPLKQAEYHRTLCDESQRLNRLVENVLTYSRLEKGARRTQCRAIDLGELLAGLQERLRARADAAGMELRLHVSDGPPARALGDPAAVEQILVNLVDNACKYAAGGADKRIELSVERDGNGIAIVVRDHGPGIAPPDRRRLFRPFRRGTGPAVAATGGVGLGLAISRRLARAMGGDLRLERSAAGAAFRLALLNGNNK